MDPAAIIPVPDAIPVHWTWLKVLLLLTFTIHIVLMNVMLGSAFIACISHFFKRTSEVPQAQAAANTLPFSIALAVNFGVAPLLFVQVLYGQFIYTSSILMAPFWLSIVGLLMTAYGLAYLYKYKYLQFVDGRILIAGAITLIFLLIGLLFTNNMTLMLHPETWQRYFEQQGGIMLNFGDPTIWPRYLHFMAASVALGGLAIALYFSFKKKHGNAEARRWIRSGCTWFSYATMVNIVIGIWFLSTLPKGLINFSSTNGVLFLIFLIVGIIAAVFAVLFAFQERLKPAIHAIMVTIVLMILVRDLLRSAYLAPWFSPSELIVEPTYTPFILFVIALVGGVFVLRWMFLLLMRQVHKPKELQS